MTICQSGQDVIVIGSGVGGAMVARRLSERGIRVLIIERGNFIPSEADNWRVEAVFSNKKYKARDNWYDRHNRRFDPGMYYNVGGSTKFYGAAMLRLRERDFEAIEHHGGLSPMWPYTYRDLAPHYDEAEKIFGIHGDETQDPTSPRGGTPFPFPPVASEPIVEKMAQQLRNQGLSPSPLPLAVATGAAGACILCGSCDGFPCKIEAKNEAQTCGINPALATGRLELLTGAFARRLLPGPDGKRIDRVEVEHQGSIKFFSARLFVVSCNAVNSAALLLRSAAPSAPNGLANSAGVVGRHYMVHNQTALMALSPRVNPTVFQKTLAINDWYFGDDDFPWPMGHMQMLGKLQAGMLSANVRTLPPSLSQAMARRSVDWIALSEDLPDPNNRVTVEGNRIRLSITLNNLKGHVELVRRMKKALKKAHYPWVLTKSLVAHATAHQCGTVKMGNDPAVSALDSYCRTWDIANLFVVDASFFPSSAAVNPALTIAAQALRASDHMLATDLA